MLSLLIFLCNIMIKVTNYIITDSLNMRIKMSTFVLFVTTAVWAHSLNSIAELLYEGNKISQNMINITVTSL